jgi:hypothetical protein
MGGTSLLRHCQESQKGFLKQNRLLPQKSADFNRYALKIKLDKEIPSKRNQEYQIAGHLQKGNHDYRGSLY